MIMSLRRASLRSRIFTLSTFNRYLWYGGVLIVTLLIAIGAVYGWYKLFRPCEVDAVEKASAILISQASMYDRVYQSAINAPPTLVDGPLIAMQQTQMDTQAVVVPACMQTAKDELLNYMVVVIRAFRAYEVREADETVRALVAKSNAHYDIFSAELKAVKKCAPFCIP
jgi:hypothetical protein